MAAAHGKCLVKTEKALNLGVEDTNRKRVPPGGSRLHQKALNLDKVFSKGSPKMRDTKPFTASKE